jgi:hypothetical protein
VACGCDVQVAWPGVFGGSSALDEQVRSRGVGATDPTVKTTVPQAQPVCLALREDLPRRLSGFIQDVEQLIHVQEIST